MPRVLKLAAVGLLTLSFLINATIVWTRLPKLGFGDFVIFFTGAQIVKDGDGENLYNLERQTQYQQKLGFVSVFNPRGIFPFNHPPYELLPFLPLTYLSFKSAYILWAAISLVLLVVTSLLLFFYFPSEHRLILSAIILTFSPAWIAILRGQDSVVSALLLTGAFLSLKSGRETAAGCLLGLGLYKPQLVLPLAVLLLVKRRWISVRAFIFTGLALVAVSSAMIGWSGVISYVKFLSWINRTHYAIYPGNMANVHGFVEAVLGFSHPGAVSSPLIGVISVALFIWCLSRWRGGWEPTDPLFDLRFSHLIVITLLISYHAYVYDLTLLALALVLSLRFAAIKPATSTVFLAPLLMVSAAFCFPLVLHIVDDTKLMAWVSLLIFFLAFILSIEITASSRNRRCPECAGESSNREIALL